jgi:TPR repeat protein
MRERGVPQDYAAAAKFFRKAADQGKAEAQAMLGTMYFFGRGVPKDRTAQLTGSDASRSAPSARLVGARILKKVGLSD